jgi:hypothetical protein
MIGAKYAHGSWHAGATWRKIMLRFVADENFNNIITRGLRRQQPALDLVRIQDVAGLPGAADPVVLAWAAEEGRIILTHDLATMPHHAYERIGVFAIDEGLPPGQMIDELHVIAALRDHEEFVDQVWYLLLLT